MRRPGSAMDESLPRGPQPAGRPDRPKRLPDWWPRARALLQQGHSLKLVGERVGVSRQRVQQIASKAEGSGETFGRRRQNPPAPRPCAQCGTLFRPSRRKGRLLLQAMCRPGPERKEPPRRNDPARLRAALRRKIVLGNRRHPEHLAGPVPAFSPDTGTALRPRVGPADRPRSARHTGQARLAPVAARELSRPGDACFPGRTCEPIVGPDERRCGEYFTPCNDRATAAAMPCPGRNDLERDPARCRRRLLARKTRRRAATSRSTSRYMAARRTLPGRTAPTRSPNCSPSR